MPFVTLNCGALPSELIEAELFGADAGAYTGANKAREGKFEAADGGTLFLDEIGNLPLAGQMKLLRVLETGRFERLGSNRERQVKVRVISATNADLPAMIREGSLPRRPVLPAQRDRAARCRRWPNVPATSCRWPSTSVPADKPLGESARAALLRHAWPGNVRELRNVDPARRAAGAGEPHRGGRPRPARGAAPCATRPWRNRTAPTIEAALARAGGVIAQAAADLGLSRQALYRRMERFGIKHRHEPPLPLAGRVLSWLLPLAGAGAGRVPRRCCRTGLATTSSRCWCSAHRWCVPLATWAIASRAARTLTRCSARWPAASTATATANTTSASTGAANDELAELVAVACRAGRGAARTAPSLVQRELLLDTMVQNTPVAMLLVAPGGDGVRRVVFANLAARKLLHSGWKLEGQRFDALIGAAPVEMREALDRGGDGLFAIGSDDEDDEEQVYHLARRQLPPQRPRARTAAAAPADQRTAPPGSADLEEGDPRDQPRAQQLAGAGRVAGALGRGAACGAGRHERLDEVFGTIEERARHLEGFIRGYARFAKLPQPRLRDGGLARLPRRGCSGRSRSSCEAAGRRRSAASTWRSSNRRCSTC